MYHVGWFGCPELLQFAPDRQAKAQFAITGQGDAWREQLIGGESSDLLVFLARPHDHQSVIARRQSCGQMAESHCDTIDLGQVGFRHQGD